MQLRSYPKALALGHAGLADLLTGWVKVQEKIDGSQFSFGMVQPDKGGPRQLEIRSKSANIHPEAPPKMFAKAVETVLAFQERLNTGWTYRGEVLNGPRHNVLAYDRVPKGNIILFDIDMGYEKYGSPLVLADEAARLGVESVPLIADVYGPKITPEDFQTWLKRMSVLGGSLIEGVVIKAYGSFGKDGKTLMGKYVSEKFKEIHGGEWRKNNPTRKDIVQVLIGNLRTPARWEKAIQHLKESDLLKNEPADIGPLLKEINKDVLEEEGDTIKDVLFRYHWKDIQRGIVQGFPQWYKDRLAKEQFAGEAGCLVNHPDGVCPDKENPSGQDAEQTEPEREEGLDDAASSVSET